MIRNAEQIRRDNLRKRLIEEQQFNYELEVANESIDKDIRDNEETLNFLFDSVTDCKQVLRRLDNARSNEVSNENIDPAGKIKAAFDSYNQLLHNFNGKVTEDSDEYFKKLVKTVKPIALSDVTVEGYGFGVGHLGHIHLAKEGVGEWISKLIEKIKAFFKYLINKIKEWITKFHRFFDSLKKNCEQLISKFKSASLPSNFTDYQSQVFMEWMTNTFPLGLATCTEIGFSSDINKAGSKVIALMEDSNEFNVDLSLIQRIEPRDINSYNQGLSNYIENTIFTKRTRSLAADSQISTVLKKSNAKLKFQEPLIKLIGYDSNELAILEYEKLNDPNKINGYKFHSIKIRDIGLKFPENTAGNHFFNGNIPLTAEQILQSAIKALSANQANLEKRASTLSDVTKKLLREVETFKQNDNEQASKCLKDYANFHTSFFNAKFKWSISGGYDVLRKAYDMCNKAHMLLTSNEAGN